MDLDPVMIAAGLGCRHGVPAEAVIDLLREAIAQAGKRPTLLAIPDFKCYEPGLLEAARRLDLTLLRISNAALRAEQPRCVTFSERAGEAVGVRSVAEACALAAAGPHGRLVLKRIAREGVTCAFAVADAAHQQAGTAGTTGSGVGRELPVQRRTAGPDQSQSFKDLELFARKLPFIHDSWTGRVVARSCRPASR